MSGPVALREDLARLDGYRPPPQDARVKLNQNESPFDLPPALKRAVCRRILERDWARYPNVAGTELSRAVAAFADWPEDGILVGNGSNELIQWTLVAAVPARARVLIAGPTFPLYAIQAVLREAEAVVVPCAGPPRFEPGAFLRAVREQSPAVAIVCSPNNPTGAVLEPAALEEILRAAGDRLVIADEAYREFAGQDFRPLLDRHQNLVLLRTFSKAYGLAALRVGYLLARPEVSRVIEKARLPYNLNIISALAARWVLERPALIRKRVERIVRERKRLLRRLAAVEGVRPFAGGANFILADVGERPRTVVERLMGRGILIRDVSRYPGLGRCVRITVGTRREDDALLAALPAALREAAEEGGA